jgi:histidine triad (HIT) family protein
LTARHGCWHYTRVTIFEKIARREIPAEIVYEEEDFLVIRDLHPQAPVHVLMIPKKAIPRVGEAEAGDAEVLGRMLAASGKVARQLGVYESGYRLVINHGADAGETVPHLHIHLLGKRSLAWPPG